MPVTFKVLAISGSLRTRSINSEVLRAAQQLAPADFKFTMYDKLAALPHFNPDLDAGEPIASVEDWRQHLRDAHGVVISSPEYAHGVPGAFKNALDWVVGSGEFMFKPVALIGASMSSAFVGPQVKETLSVMMGNVVPDANVTLSLSGNKRDATSMLADEMVSRELRDAMLALRAAMIAS